MNSNFVYVNKSKSYSCSDLNYYDPSCTEEEIERIADSIPNLSNPKMQKFRLSNEILTAYKLRGCPASLIRKIVPILELDYKKKSFRGCIRCGKIYERRIS